MSVEGEVLDFMVISHFLHLHLVAGLHVPQYLQIAVPDAILEDGCKDYVPLIEGEIDDEGMRRFPSEFEVVQHLELLVEDLEGVGASF